MAFKNNRASLRQPLRNAGTLQIRARNLVSKRKQYLGNAAHADAADAYKMNTLNFCKHSLCRFAPNRYRALPDLYFLLRLISWARPQSYLPNQILQFALFAFIRG